MNRKPRNLHLAIQRGLLGFLCLVPMVGVWLISDPVDRQVVANTLMLGLFSALVAVPLGGFICWSVAGRGFMSRLLLLACVGLFAVPVLLQASGWDSAFGKLGWFTSERGQVLKPVLTGWPAAVWIHGVAAAPQVAVILLIGMAVNKRQQEEQALLDAGATSVFWHVTLGQLAPIVIAAAIWVVVGCAREIAVTDLYQIGTLAEQIYLGFSLGQMNNLAGNWTPTQLEQARNLGPWVTIGTIAWLTLAASWVFTRLSDAPKEASGWRPAELLQRKSSRLKSCCAFLLLVLLVLVPLGNLVLRASFHVQRINGQPTPGYSLQQARLSLESVFLNHLTEFQWSALIALCATATIVAVGLAVCWLASQRGFVRWLLISSIAFCCAVPGPLWGKWISTVFSNTGIEWINTLYDRSIFAPVLATTIMYWPIGVLMIWFLFSRIDQDALDSARSEGARGWRLLLDFGIGSNRVALLGTAAVCFAFSFGELAATQAVLPPGMDTVPRLTLGLMHAGVNEMTAALTFVTSGGLILISVAGWVLVWLNERRRDGK